MNVVVSVNGRFHGFDLAWQLYRRRNLARLITSYPKFKTRQWNIPDNEVISLLPVELFNRCMRFLPNSSRHYFTPIQHDLFDRFAGMFIPEHTDIFVGWSSSSLRSIRKAKPMGIKTIVERGSSHILYQSKVLREEYNGRGIRNEHIPRAIIEKELQEYEEAGFICVPSLFVKRTFLERGIDEKKIIHVPFGVNISDFRPVPKDDNIFRVMHCGGMILRKGVHYLLRAFSELDLPNSELWLVGAMTEEMKPFYGKYDNGKVFLKGHQPQNQLYKFYSQASVFCLASVEEGLAMVIPQAMACGLPVICTANTGGEDIVREGVDGFIIPIRDVEALKEKILYMYENQARCREMGESARKRVERGFTWDDYGERIVKAYRTVLSSD